MEFNLSKKAALWIGGAGIAAVITIIAFFSIAEFVGEGEVAIVYTPAEGAKKVFEPGMNFVWPLEKTYSFSVRQEVIETKVKVNTSDGKLVTIPVSYNVTIKADEALKLFKKYGPRGQEYYYNTVIQQQLNRLAKETVVQYTTLQIFTDKLTEAGNAVGEKVAKNLDPKGFTIDELAFMSPEIDKSTKQAIDAQVAAQQANELKKLELENEKIEADKNAVIENGKAEQKRIQAKGDADAKKTAADAEAYANQKVSSSLTDNVLKQLELEARKAHGWVTIQGAGNTIVDATK